MQLTRSSRRTVVAVTALAVTALAPAAAEAAAVKFKGTVVAKDGARQTLAVAGKGGEVRTVRIERGIRKYRVGQRLVVRGGAASDGTYTPKRIRAVGRASKARVRAAVVQRRADRYLVTAGKSTFSIKRRGAGARTSAAAAGVGDIVVVDVTLGAGGPGGTTFREVGHADALEIEGIYLGQENGVLELAVERRGRVLVKVPAELTVAADPGDEVELLVTIDENGGFVLVALDGDDRDGDEYGFELDMEDGEVEIHGLVGAVGESSITVEAGPSAAVTCTVPAGTSLAEFGVGDEVEMECELADNGSWELREIESEAGAELEVEPDDDDDEDDEDRANVA